MSILFLLLKLNLCLADAEINGHFKYCTTSMTSNTITIRNGCEIQQNADKIKMNEPYRVLEKMTYSINGEAFACKMTKTIHKSTFHWYLVKEEPTQTSFDVDLSREDCTAMITTKKCESHEMTCTESTCAVEYRPQISYQYAATLTFHGVKCEINKIIVYGKDLEAKLFNNARSACRASDLYCKTNDLTIIWFEEAIHNCPFQEIAKMQLNVTNDIYWSDEHNLLFQTTSVAKQCDTLFYETSEQLYLLHESNNLNLISSPRELKTSQHLILSDMDYKHFTMNRQSNERTNKLSEQMCQTLKTLLRIFAKQQNEFLILNDLKGDELILFNNDGLIQIADCKNISRIKVIEKMADFFEQPEAIIYINGSETKVSVFNDLIVAKDKEIKINCNRRRITQLPELDRVMITQNGRTDIFKLEDTPKSIATVDWTNGKIDANQTKLLDEYFDPIKQIERLTKIRDMNSHTIIIPEIGPEIPA
jgi:hypothetical protein